MNVIKPISFGKPGVCLVCGKSMLCLINKDVDLHYLSEYGDPIGHKNLRTESKVICLNCSSVFDYDKAGFRIIPISQQVSNMRKLQCKREENESIL